MHCLTGYSASSTFSVLPLRRRKPAITNNNTMEAMNEFEQLPMNDSSVIEEAKALIEKLQTMTQASATSTPAVHELPSVEPAVFDDHGDDTSEFSGYSLLTPSAASKSHRDEEKLPLDQQVCVEEQVDIHGDSNAPEFDISGLDFDAIEGSPTIKQPQQDVIDASQNESEPANRKRKLVGIVITFEQGVDFDEGQHAVRFVGDHLGLSIGSQAKEIRVLSIEGNGHLEVSTPSRPEPALDGSDLDYGFVEVVAKIHRVDGDRRQEDAVQGNAPTIFKDESSSFFPPLGEPVGAVATSPEKTAKTALLVQRTRLAKARTLRALIDANNAATYSSVGPDVNVQEAGKGATAAENTKPPSLCRLIDIAKTKIHRELTTHERFDAPDSSKEISTKQKEVKPKKTKKTKSTNTSCVSTVAYEKVLVITASVLLFAVISLVFCLAGMGTARRGHCVGLWLGP